MRNKKGTLLTIAILGIVACTPSEVVRVARVASTGDTASLGRIATDKAIGYAANPA
ncbi:MAG: lytic murein transglycosylase, partial [Desulfobacterales bacterium]|nr:lytic murein transglycosylase [Desulfobacterales bacterium]